MQTNPLRFGFATFEGFIVFAILCILAGLNLFTVGIWQNDGPTNGIQWCGVILTMLFDFLIVLLIALSIIYRPQKKLR